MWSKAVFRAISEKAESPQMTVRQGVRAFRLCVVERTPPRSQTRRDTNFAIPGYSISAMIPRRTVKIKFFLSVVIPVVKNAFMPLSAIGGKSRKRRHRKALRRFALTRPGYRHGTPKAGALPAALHPDMYFSARQHAFAHILKGNGAFCRTRFPRSRSAAACAFRLHRRQTCTFCNLRKIKFNTFFRNSQRFSALQF